MSDAQHQLSVLQYSLIMSCLPSLAERQWIVLELCKHSKGHCPTRTPQPWIAVRQATVSQTKVGVVVQSALECLHNSTLCWESEHLYCRIYALYQLI